MVCERIVNLILRAFKSGVSVLGGATNPSAPVCFSSSGFGVALREGGLQRYREVTGALAVVMWSSSFLSALEEPLPDLSSLYHAASGNSSPILFSLGPRLRDLLLEEEGVPVQPLAGIFELSSVPGILEVATREVSDTLIRRGMKRRPGRVGTRAQRFGKRRPPEIAPWTLDKARWRLTWKGRWQRVEHTNVQEFRTIALLGRKLSMNHHVWGSRVLIFSDSTAALGCLAKGRSSRPGMLRISRQIAALALGLGIRLVGRYVRSELNYADGPSRGEGVGVAGETVLAHADRDRALQDAFRLALGGSPAL